MALALNKHDTDGRRYRRRPAVEAAIDALLKQDIEIVCRQADIQDRRSSEFIAPECMVHLIREARRRNDETSMNRFLLPLLRRCEASLLSRVSNQFPNAQDIREEVLGQFGELFASDGRGTNPDALDFFEVRFNRAFKAFRIDILRRELREQDNRKTIYVPLPDTEGTDPISDEDLSKYFRTPPAQESGFELRAALLALPQDEQRAVVLCYIMGYDVESKDPEKRTAATICGISGRTIRNRLARAAVKLSSFKERRQ